MSEGMPLMSRASICTIFAPLTPKASRSPSATTLALFASALLSAYKAVKVANSSVMKSA